MTEYNLCLTILAISVIASVILTAIAKLIDRL